MTEYVVSALLLFGSTFMFVGAVGIVRMPDLFSRMQATTKSPTLGIGCVLAAVAVYYGQTGVSARAGLIIAFYFLTAPVAAHMIGRAAHRIGVPMWEGTIIDELQEARTADPDAPDHAEGTGQRTASPAATRDATSPSP